MLIQRIQRSFFHAGLSLPYWLALVGAFLSYAIISDNLWFASTLAFAAIAIRFLPHSENNESQAPFKAKRSARDRLARTTSAALRFLYPFIAYTIALLALWPDSPWAYYGLPAALIFTLSFIAAIDKHSYGGSRGFTSIAGIAFLLLIRNVVILHEFEPPFPELGQATAFVCFIEIALSTRFHRSQEKPHPELIFGIGLVAIASFHFTSLPLAILLAALPVISFLIRNYDTARISPEHTRPANSFNSPTPPPPHGKSSFALLAALPLLFATAFYLAALRIPFWTELVTEDVPYAVEAVADRANLVSDSSALDDYKAQRIAEKVLPHPQSIKAKTDEIVTSLKRKLNEPTTESENPAALENKHSIEQPPKARTPPPWSFTGRSEQANDRAATARVSKEATGSAPTAEIDKAYNTGLGFEGYGFSTDDPTSLTENERSRADRKSQNTATNEEAQDFSRFLDNFSQPEKAIAQSLNLQNSEVSTLLDERPLVTVTLDSTRNTPHRLYLRSNVLDTVSKFGLGGIRAETGRATIDVAANRRISIDSFQQSKSGGTTATITTSPGASTLLPLPESFNSIQFFDTDSVDVYPDEQVVLAPARDKPLTYRVYEADLDVTARERTPASSSDAYIRGMLEVPLSRGDRRYLENLAEDIGGARTSPERFANRFGRYFAERHPYSYFVEIPAGPEHSVVRWLKNECPGLCSNYAAAFTLLARTRGIPTRVVGGFATEEFDPTQNRYILRQNNAHAWVEYLDESNRWIRFDPTPRISEAEAQRVETFITKASPQSLPSLIKAEKENLSQAQLDQQPKQNVDTSALAALASEHSSRKESPKQTSIAPSEQLLTDFSQNEAPTSSPNKHIASPTTSKRVNENAEDSIPDATKPETDLTHHAGAIAEDALDNPSARNNKTTTGESASSVTQTAPSPAKRSPPWLFLLAILAVAIPALTYLLRIKSESPATPEIKLRNQAGRLLAQLETLMHAHHLESDPVWTEARETLHAQRYGREPNPLLVKDISVKIALLAKKK